MNEQIFLGGAPVVGFGASEYDEKRVYGTVIGGPLVGLVAGSVAGYFVGRGAHPVIGTVVGGLAGTTVGIAGAVLILRNTRLSAT